MKQTQNRSSGFDLGTVEQTLLGLYSSSRFVKWLKYSAKLGTAPHTKATASLN